MNSDSTAKAILAALIVFSCLACVPTFVFADGEDFKAPNSDNSQVGADAQIDKRLPPVFPGEEVSDGKKKIKVWSTSGSVSAERAPEPFRDEQQIPNLSTGVGVVVDGRNDGNHSHRER